MSRRAQPSWPGAVGNLEEDAPRGGLVYSLSKHQVVVNFSEAAIFPSWQLFRHVPALHSCNYPLSCSSFLVSRRPVLGIPGLAYRLFPVHKEQQAFLFGG